MHVGEPDRRLATGQEVELSAWIGRFGGPDNPGQVDWAQRARYNHQLVWASTPGADGVTIRAGQGAAGWTRWLRRLRANWRAHLSVSGGPQSRRITEALILGERHPALRSLNDTMVRAGTAHLLSISGLHLGVFLGFLYLLCRLAALGPRPAAVVVLGVLAAFMLLAEPRPPLLRSAIMAAALCVGVIVRRRAGGLNALALAAIVLLAIDPLQLFSAGFQLSFVTVGGLILLHRPVRDRLFRRWRRRRGLMVFRDDQCLRRRLHYSAANWLMDGAAMAVTAYLVSAPLVAYHFGIFSPYAIVLSLLLLPPVAAVLIPGYLSLGLQFAMPNLSHQFSRLAAGTADFLAWLVSAVDLLPGLCLELRPVPAAWVLGFYVTVAVILIRKVIPFGRVLAGLAAVAWVAGTVAAQLPAPAPKEAQLDILAVGAGQCALLRTPTGQTCLLDAGTQSDLDAARQVLLPFLRHERLGVPPAAWVSHANTDHFNLLGPLLDDGRLRRVYLNDYFARDANTASPPAQHFFQRLRDAGVRIVRLRAGQRIQLDDRTRIEVLWPPADRRDDLTVNDTSLVLRIVCDGRSVLLTGDLGPVGQAALTRTPSAVAADVLLCPHHGGWETTLPAFVDAVDAKIVVVSGAGQPRAPAAAGKAAQDFYARLRTGTEYYCTARNGWTRIRFGRGKVTVRTMR